MNDILTDYREWRDAQPERVATHSDRCHMWHERCMIHRLAAALERARLTDAERGAIAAGLGALETLYEDAPAISRPIYDAYAPTLRGLLERTKG